MAAEITRARTTTAAATPRANARRPKTEELRVAIARLAMSTMARIAAQRASATPVTLFAPKRIVATSTQTALVTRTATTMAISAKTSDARTQFRDPTSARQTMAAVTKNANARSKTEELRVAIARLALSTMA